MFSTYLTETDSQLLWKRFPDGIFPFGWDMNAGVFPALSLVLLLEKESSIINHSVHYTVIFEDISSTYVLFNVMEFYLWSLLHVY